MKRKVILTVLILSALFITTSQIVPPLLKTSEQEAAKNTLIASHVYDSINSEIQNPIIIAKTMSADFFLMDALRKELSTSEAEMEKFMTEYLNSIKERFGYFAAFVISEKTHRYYTPNGIDKIVNPQNDPYDIWYQLFLDSGKEIDLDTDRDQANGYKWTVFLNARITDSDGKLMGVCGVGLFMEQLQELISAVEKQYNVKVNLIEHNGLVQVDTDSSNIENAYISEAIADNAGPFEFTYRERRFGGFRLTRYMKELEWYLVVQGFGNASGLFATKLSIAFLYLLLLTVIVFTFIRERKKGVHNLVKSASPEDVLTGLPNRNYLKESYGELGVFNTTRYKSLVMFDIDRFKTVNEDRDGDEIILGIVNLAKKTVDERGIIFRWAGDEFVIFLEMTADEAEERFKEFCAEVKRNLDVTVSVGIVEIDFSESIKTNYHRAVQPCYAVKEAGGNGVGRK